MGTGNTNAGDVSAMEATAPAVPDPGAPVDFDTFTGDEVSGDGSGEALPPMEAVSEIPLDASGNLPAGTVPYDVPPLAVPSVPSVPPIAVHPGPVPIAATPIVVSEPGAPRPATPAVAPVVAAERVTVSVPVDTNRERDIGDKIKVALRDSVADLVGTATHVAEEYASVYAPLIARQALLETSSDPATALRAAGNKRHLWAQMLMRAGQYGIPLQQKQETRLLTVAGTILQTAIGYARV